MPVLKLSQIAASAANFADGDSIVTVQSSATDVRLTRTQLFGFPALQLGSSDAAAPVAQTLQVQSVVAGTSNTAGVDWTFVGSKGTGTGGGGNFIFKLAPAGTTGTAQNAAIERFKILAAPSGAPYASFLFTMPNTGFNASRVAFEGGTAVTNVGFYFSEASAARKWTMASLAGGGTNRDFQFYNEQSSLNGIYINGDTQSISFQPAATFGWALNNASIRTPDTLIGRAGVATLQQGAADAAAPVAQTLQVQSVVAGTSNTAGVDWTFVGSKGTGTGAGGSIIFKTAPCSSGTGATAQNPVQTGLSITASSVATFTQQPSIVIGSSQLNSSAVEGFLYIPTVNGPPTGAPTTYTGRVPIVFDSSNNRLYVYNSSGATWVGGTVPGTWS